ncbi:MAG: PTS sugar transporter subunit IIA [Phycisphaerales bacterium]|jgi:PTS system nitrogen regulatory IIA component
MLEPMLLRELVRRLPERPDATMLIRTCSEQMSAVTGLAAPTLEQAFTERLRRGGVATSEGVAFPHAVIAGVRRTAVGCLLIPGGVDLDPAQPASDLVFVLAGDSARPWEHVRLLARLSRIAADEASRKRIRAATTDAALLEILLKEDASHG